jgi:hypothetical protein
MLFASRSCFNKKMSIHRLRDPLHKRGCGT